MTIVEALNYLMQNPINKIGTDNMLGYWRYSKVFECFQHVADDRITCEKLPMLDDHRGWYGVGPVVRYKITFLERGEAVVNDWQNNYTSFERMSTKLDDLLDKGYEVTVKKYVTIHRYSEDMPVEKGGL